MRCRFLPTLAAGLVLLALRPPSAAPADPTPIGRWDITVQAPGDPYPSWLEVQLSGRSTLVGYFVSRFGSVRPISHVQYQNGQLKFSLPVQWEEGNGDLSFEGKLDGEQLSGTTVTADGKRFPWTAVRAPALKRTAEPRWGAPIELFNGKNLDGWEKRHAGRPNGWEVKNGLLVNARPGNDLVTKDRWMDFKLRAEFRYPRGSNSGIYLRGRYEAQVEDNYGDEPESHKIGGIYGFVTPRINAAKPAGEWQTYEFTLVGRRVTITLNGEMVADRQEIPGITGGALDNREGDPGPIMLQGDHGSVEFRRLTLTPAAP